MEEEKVKLKLDIAGEALILSVPYSQQEETRNTENEVNQVFAAWRARFPEKSDREVLAMIAFRYADRYAALKREREETMREMDRLNAELDAFIAS